MESKSTHAALLAHLSTYLAQTGQEPESAKEEVADPESAKKKAKDPKRKKNGSKSGKSGGKDKKKAGKNKKSKKAGSLKKDSRHRQDADAGMTAIANADTKLNCENSPFYDQEKLGGMLALVDAAGSFIHAGSTVQLQDFFSSAYPAQERGTARQTVTEAIGTLVTFSDAVALCDIEHLGPAAMTVSGALDRIEAIAPEDADLYIEMLKALVPDIRRKMYTDQWTDETTVYPAVIRWTAENRLLQQAVNLYIEKMPQVYMSAGSKVRSWIPKMIEFPSGDPVDQFASDLYIGVRKMDGSVDKERVFKQCVRNILNACEPDMDSEMIRDQISREIAVIAEKGSESAKRDDQVAYAKLETGLENLNAYVQNASNGSGWGQIYGTQPDFAGLREFFGLACSDSRLARYFILDYGAPHEVIRSIDAGTFTSRVESLRILEKAIAGMTDADDRENDAGAEDLTNLLRLMQHYMAMRLTRRLMSQDKESGSSLNKELLADQRIAYGYLQEAGIPVDAEVDKIVKIILDGLQITE